MLGSINRLRQTDSTGIHQTITKLMLHVFSYTVEWATSIRDQVVENAAILIKSKSGEGTEPLLPETDCRVAKFLCRYGSIRMRISLDPSMML
jgi:hypothetical protein